MSSHILEEHILLKNKISEYVNNNIDYKSLKKYSAPVGVYKQRNDRFMIRTRITGGELQLREFESIIKVSQKYKIKFLHLTTRQDIQLHEVEPKHIFRIIQDLSNEGFYFKGGCGDTLRNITSCHFSGLTENTVFDVLPYSKALAKSLYSYSKAYSLPRKFKISFSCNSKDKSLAKFSDLGFIAKIKNNKRGFEVYIGGGLGKNFSQAVKAFDFICDSDVFRCSLAVIDLFYDYGDRINRNRARLRYVKDKLGKDNFLKLFKEYYYKTHSFRVDIVSEKYYKIFYKRDKKSLNYSGIFSSKSEFNKWREYNISTTKWRDLVLVKINIPYRDITPSDAEFLFRVFKKLEVPFIRLTRENHIYIPLPTDHLEWIYDRLLGFKHIYDFISDSVKGSLTSCIGAETCALGIINVKPFVDSLTVKLIELDSQSTTDKRQLIKKILSKIKFSGCYNSCSNHEAAEIAMIGCKRRNSEGEVVPHIKLVVNEKLKKQLNYSGDIYMQASDMKCLAERLINLNFLKLSSPDDIITGKYE